MEAAARREKFAPHIRARDHAKAVQVDREALKEANDLDPQNLMGKMFFNILATFAEFEVDLLRMRTREGRAVARAKGRLRGRQLKLSAKQRTELRRMYAIGEYTIVDLAELFGVSRPTVYRTLQRDNATRSVVTPP